MREKNCVPVVYSNCLVSHSYADQWHPHQQNEEMPKLWQSHDIMRAFD